MPVRPLARPFIIAALAFVAGACQDGLTAPGTTRLPTVPTAAVPNGQALACTVDVRAHTLGCASVTPATSRAPHAVSGPQRTLVIGKQGVYVKLTSSATTSSGDTLSVPVSVQNLLSQPLGTTDGVSYDGRGVTVFFQQNPTATSGTGTVTVLNADTTGTYTAAGQPAFLYRQFVAGNQTTSEHNWLFSVPHSVTTFQFLVFVSAQVPDESVPLAAQPAHSFSTNATAAIVGGQHYTCALRPGAGVYCWGSTTVPGDMGQMNAASSPVPLLVPGSAGAVALAPSVGAGHACWITGAGAAACVGNNTFGQLGDGTFDDGITPRTVQMPAGVTVFSRLVAGAQHTCGLTSAGVAYCWGYNGLGQLGNGTYTDDSIATAVQMPAGMHVAALGTGEVHSCALTDVGAAYCWGYNGNGQLGDGTTDPAAAPVLVQLPSGVTLTGIAGGFGFTCGLAGDGAAYCWGDNSAGQLGDGTTVSRGAPGRVQIPGGAALAQVVVGLNHACALGRDGAVYCWGEGSSGQIGDAQFTARPTPVAVALPPGTAAAQLSAGGDHSCAITSAGAAYCWGSNAYGQIGDGASGPGTDRGSPVAVRMP